MWRSPLMVSHATGFLFIILAGCGLQDPGSLSPQIDGKAETGWLDSSDQIPENLTRLVRAVATLDSAAWVQQDEGETQWLPSKLVIDYEDGEVLEYDEEASVAEWVSKNFSLPPCKEEARLWLPVRGWGTAFLIHPRVLATVRHNVEHMSCDAENPHDRLVVVFDDPEDRQPVDAFDEAYEPVPLSEDKVYGCLDIHIDQDSDAALILLDRVRDIDLFSLSTTEEQPPIGAEVVHLGQPAGMTTQVSFGQVIPRPQPSEDEHQHVGVGFRHNAMSAKGSSGGPVLIAEDGGYSVWGAHAGGWPIGRAKFFAEKDGCIGYTKPSDRFGTAVHASVLADLLRDVTTRWDL